MDLHRIKSQTKSEIFFFTILQTNLLTYIQYVQNLRDNIQHLLPPPTSRKDFLDQVEIPQLSD